VAVRDPRTAQTRATLVHHRGRDRDTVVLCRCAAGLCLHAERTGLHFLLGFTPESVSNFVDVSRYVSFFLRTVIVFGIGFLLPLFALLLNLAGVLPASTMINAWRWIIVGIFLFAAVATPDGNPITMTMLALPIMLLLTVVMGIAWLHDRRAGKKAAEESVPDDEIRPIDEPTPIDAPTAIDGTDSVDSPSSAD
jgi:hypothetical protein